MTHMKIQWTYYPNIYRTSEFEHREGTWDEVVASMSTHTRLSPKDVGPCFGPYHIHAPWTTCIKHQDGVPRPHAHRCDSSMSALTMAVFDMDSGSESDVQETLGALRTAGLAHHVYSSYSHGTKRPGGKTHVAYRLVLPLSEPVDNEYWPAFRQAVLSRFHIPADVKTSGGRSHSFFLPACPHHSVDPVVITHPGAPLLVTEFIARAAPLFRIAVDLPDYAPPPEPTEPVDIGPLLEKARAKVTRLERNPATAANGALLRRCLAGEPLATHGSRNQSTLVVAGILAYLLPGTPLSIFLHIMRPSVQAMIDAGSSVTHAKLERMVLTAMRDKYLATAREDEIAKVLFKGLQAREARLNAMLANFEPAG